jgi:hypothetical protein
MFSLDFLSLSTFFRLELVRYGLYATARISFKVTLRITLATLVI